jgi:hypothetical protein
MPIIWCAISGHGYGHAAQVVPVLNELGRFLPNLQAILRTAVPAAFFRGRLTIPWTLQSVEQDVGCIQNGPLVIDIPATWEAHDQFHAGWEQRMAKEVAAMRAAAPQVIVADTPYLTASAGKEAGIPTVALANFTWHETLKPFADPEKPQHQAILETMRHSYGHAALALRIAPGLPLSVFSNVVDIGPIAETAYSRREDIRKHLGVNESERLVLLAFGGIALESLPWEQMQQMQGYHFIVSTPPIRPSPRIHVDSTIPHSFSTLIASVDLVMTKPGYGTIIEAVTHGVPVVYVRRYNFADEPPLVEFLHQYGRGQELSLIDFLAGKWQPAFEAIYCTRPSAIPPPSTGAADAARLLLPFFQ